jgi:hypothetical protein
MKIYIQQNKKQYLASKIAASSFLRNGVENKNIFFIEFEKNKLLNDQLGKKYLKNGKLKIFKNDLQSFTLLRFLAPEINNFKDRILVIDPDVFAIKNISRIFNEINNDEEIGCTFYNNRPRSEVMIINAFKVRWNFNKIIDDIFNLKLDYSNVMSLGFEDNRKIKEISKIYNSHDKIFPNTILLHTTNRITQPWKEGLKIDFEIHQSKYYCLKQYFKKFIGKNFDSSVTEKKYLRHPDVKVIKKIKDFFIYSKKNNYISDLEIEESIKEKNFSKVFIDKCNYR